MRLKTDVYINQVNKLVLEELYAESKRTPWSFWKTFFMYHSLT